MNELVKQLDFNECAFVKLDENKLAEIDNSSKADELSEQPDFAKKELINDLFQKQLENILNIMNDNYIINEYSRMFE
jgi:hypothetical protein